MRIQGYHYTLTMHQRPESYWRKPVHAEKNTSIDPKIVRIVFANGTALIKKGKGEA